MHHSKTYEPFAWGLYRPFLYRKNGWCDFFSKTIEEHIEHLNKILKCLADANLKLQIDKCEFAKCEIEFLGHVLNEKGLKLSFKNVEAIEKIKLPTTQKQIKSFLGITSYLRRYIKDYSKIAKHLIKYLKKNSKINAKGIEFIEALKLLIKSDPIEVYPDLKKSSHLIQTPATMPWEGL